MTRFSLARFAAVAAASFISAALSAQTVAPRRLAQFSASNAARVALADSASGRPAASQLLGHLPADTTLTGLSLVLKPTAEQDAALTQLLADQQNPSSPSYHQWLTPQQFGERFGLADGDLNVLTSWLENAGLRVDSVAPSRNSITFSGSVASVESAFGVTMDRYRRDGQEFFENNDSVQLPGAMAGVIGGVSGLSSYRMASPMHVRMPEPASTSAHGVSASPQYTTSSGAHYLVPGDFRKIYGVTTLGNSGFDGAGISIGVIGQSAVDTQQLTYFQQKTAQTVTLPTMVLVPGTGVSNRVASDEVESELDLEYASGTAPGATVKFIYTGCTATASGSILPDSTDCGNDGVGDALRYAIANNLAQILSVSYGGCESSNTGYANNVLEPALRQANAQGQTIVVSSGDSGAASCDRQGVRAAANGLTVSYPASSPYVTAVGGTQLNGDSSSNWSSSNNSDLSSAVGYMPEVTWNDSVSQGAVVAGGGGVSGLFAKPVWQGGTGVPADGKRDLPDVSFPSSASFHPYMVCLGDAVCTSGTGGFTPGRDGTGIGGTSAAAPNFAAMLAVIEHANGGGALGNINPRLYTFASSSLSSPIFHDITGGGNQVPCTIGTPDCTSSPIGYAAGTGYDLATGLGSIDAVALRTALSTVTVKTPILTLLSSATSVTIGDRVTFTLTVTGPGASAPTGSVLFAIDGVSMGSTGVTLINGAVGLSYSGFYTVGNHTVTATFVSGDTNYVSGNATITVVVTQATARLTLTSSSGRPLQNAPVTFTASVFNLSLSPTGKVVFFVDGVAVTPAGITLTNGLATYVAPGFSALGIHTVSFQYSGDTSFKSSTSTDTVFTVISPSALLLPTVSLAGTLTSGTVNTPIVYRVTVTGTGPTPTGRVIFAFDGVNGTQNNLSSGTYTSPTNIAPAGIHTLTAIYSGDDYYLPSTASITITIATPGFTMQFLPNPITVRVGSTSLGVLSVTPVNDFNGVVSFRYLVTTVSGPTFTGCLATTTSNTTLSVSGGAVASLPLAVPTTGCTTPTAVPASSGRSLEPVGTRATLLPRGIGGVPLRPARTLAIVSAAGLLGCCFLRRRMRTALLLLVVSLVVCTSLSGCSSGGGGSSGGSTGTTSSSGTYTVTIAGISGTTTTTTTFTLVVQ